MFMYKEQCHVPLLSLTHAHTLQKPSRPLPRHGSAPAHRRLSGQSNQSNQERPVKSRVSETYHSLKSRHSYMQSYIHYCDRVWLMGTAASVNDSWIFVATKMRCITSRGLIFFAVCLICSRQFCPLHAGIELLPLFSCQAPPLFFHPPPLALPPDPHRQHPLPRLSRAAEGQDGGPGRDQRQDSELPVVVWIWTIRPECMGRTRLQIQKSHTEIRF